MTRPNQPSLFDSPTFASAVSPRPIFRTSDPPTSAIAAEAVAHKLGSSAARMLLAFQESGLHHSTANEAARECVERYGGNAETYRKRAKELRDGGQIISAAARKCDVTGHVATTFRAVR